jgi:hypothetical protein
MMAEPPKDLSWCSWDQYHDLMEYIRLIANMMNLRDWTFKILYEPYSSDHHAGASVECTYGRALASLKFNADFFSYPPEQQRHIVVHELTHVIMHRMDNGYDNTLRQLIGMPALTALREEYNTNMEYAVDAIADGWGDLLPLP